MKVLHIIHYGHGGIIKTIYTQGKYNTDKSIKYRVVCFCKIDQETIENFNSIGIKISHLNFHGHRVIVLIRDLMQLINDYKPDIVHTHQFLCGIIIRLYCLFSRSSMRIVTTIHNDYDYFYNSGNILKRIRSIIKRILEVTSYACFKTHVVCVSNKILQRVKNIYRLKDIIVINNGIEIIDDIKRVGRNGDIIIISIGRFDVQKNYKQLIRVLPEIIKNVINIKLILVGNGEQFEYLEEYTQKKRLENFVEFTGWVNDVYARLALADIFVLTSLFEGFPICLLEAANAELPLISSDVSGASDIIKPHYNGFLFQINNDKQLVEKLLQLIRDKNLRTKFGINSKRLIREKFNADGFVNKIEDYYKIII